MLVLLSCAKTMSTEVNAQLALDGTLPHFQTEANELATYMSRYSPAELSEILSVNQSIAIENFKRYEQFHSSETTHIQAALAYSGIVYKRLNIIDFTHQELEYAQNYLRLTSFLYGLLRPLDLIAPYRLEGGVSLPDVTAKNVYAFWRERLTDIFIEDIQKAGGVLCFLASNEMRKLFNWSRLCKTVKVVVPEFHLWKNGKLSTIVVYTKMNRGEMARYILKNRVSDVEALKFFEWEGFTFDPKNSGESSHLTKLCYTLY